MDNFKLSEEQEKVCKFIRHGIGSAFIEAYAGSGKSTTLLGCVKEIKPDKSVLMIAHNLDVVKHLREKINNEIDGRSTIGDGWKLTKVCTYHSLGYQIIKENMEKLGMKSMPEPNERKYIRYISDNLVELAGKKRVEDAESYQWAGFRANLLFLIDFCRHNINQSENDVRKTMRQFQMVQIMNEPEAVKKCLEWGKTHLDVIDYEDMIWLPYELRLNTKQYISDFVFVDEAQDTSRAQFELFKKCIKRNTRYIAVGDEYQTINQWCGSDKNSFKKFGTIGAKVTKFTLSTSFRCGKKIIELAQGIVPGIKPDSNKFDGEINENATIDDIHAGDMILCRNGAPLMSLYLKLIKQGKKAYIQGERHTYNATLAFIDGFKAQTLGELGFMAQKALIELWEGVSKEYNESLSDSAVNPRVVSMYDQVQTVLSVISCSKTIEEARKIIKEAQFDESKKSEDAIMMSTIHRAKGLEKERVFILCPSLIPSKLAKLDWEIEAEENLRYVMITRAIHSLNFIPDADGRVDPALVNPIAMYWKLEKIKRNIYLEKQ